MTMKSFLRGCGRGMMIHNIYREVSPHWHQIQMGRDGCLRLLAQAYDGLVSIHDGGTRIKTLDVIFNKNSKLQVGCQSR